MESRVKKFHEKTRWKISDNRLTPKISPRNWNHLKNMVAYENRVKISCNYEKTRLKNHVTQFLCVYFDAHTHFVLGTFCLLGRFVPGTLCLRTFCLGTFCLCTFILLIIPNKTYICPVHCTRTYLIKYIRVHIYFLRTLSPTYFWVKYWRESTENKQCAIVMQLHKYVYWIRTKYIFDTYSSSE